MIDIKTLKGYTKTEGKCWIWLRGKDKDGYGKITINVNLNGTHWTLEVV